MDDGIETVAITGASAGAGRATARKFASSGARIALLARGRDGADRGTGLSRARTEDLFYGLDVNAEKGFEAAQAGYVAPTHGRPVAPPINPFLRKRRALR